MMLKITAAYPIRDEQRIVVFGPFEYVQFSYELVRVSDDQDFAWFKDGSWLVDGKFITDGGSALFSDLTVVPVEEDTESLVKEDLRQ